MEDTEHGRWAQDVFPMLRRCGYSAVVVAGGISSSPGSEGCWGEGENCQQWRRKQNVGYRDAITESDHSRFARV